MRKRHVWRGVAIALLVASVIPAFDRDARAQTVPVTPSPAEPRLDLGRAPELVGPGVISRGLAEWGATVTPDSSRMFFTVSDRGFSRMTILESVNKAGVWSKPVVSEFSGVWNDGDAALSPDGKRLFFISNRPISGTTPRPALGLWVVDRRKSGWSAPRHIAAAGSDKENISYPTVAADGALYFLSNGRMTRMNVLDSVSYAAPTRITTGNDAFRSGAFAVAPNGRFMIISGSLQGQADSDLYVSFPDSVGNWSPPQRFAAPLNSNAFETSPFITADGLTLYFSSERGATTARRAEYWPRQRRVSSSAEVEAELLAMPQNSLRDIYRVKLDLLRVPPP